MSAFLETYAALFQASAAEILDADRTGWLARASLTANPATPEQTEAEGGPRV